MKKIYFASDAHLGARFHKDSKAVERKLVRWLTSIEKEAAEIWFLGDMFDYWYEYKYVVPKGFTRFLGKLGELSDQGIKIHFFIGNHDIWMFDYLKEEIGAIIHYEPLIIDLLGKRFFLSHGDEVDSDRSLTFLRILFRNRFCQWLYGAIHPRWTFGFALGWSFSSRTQGVKRDMSYKGEEHEKFVLFAKAYIKKHPEINFFIFGHRHLMLDLMLNRNTRVIIDGDWMDSFSYVEWDGEHLVLEQFEPKD